MEESIVGRLDQLRARLEKISESSQPNEPIESFDLPSRLAVQSWSDRIERIDRENLISELTSLLAEISLPRIDENDPRHDHLRVYHQLSIFKEDLREVITEAVNNDYPHALSLMVQTSKVSPKLDEIMGYLESIDSRIGQIEAQEGASNILDGISLSVGPISASLGSLKQLVSVARTKIRGSSSEINVSALALILTSVANSSNKLLETAEGYAKILPSKMLTVIREVAKFGYELGTKGVELVRAALHGGSGDLQVESSADLFNLKEAAKVIGLSLLRARKSLNLDQSTIAKALNLTPSYIRIIEEGTLEKFPRTVYAVGWIKSYARVVKLYDPEFENCVQNFARAGKTLDDMDIRNTQPIVDPRFEADWDRSGRKERGKSPLQ